MKIMLIKESVRLKIINCMTTLESNDKFTPFLLYILLLIYRISGDFASVH